MRQHSSFVRKISVCVSVRKTPVKDLCFSTSFEAGVQSREVPSGTPACPCPGQQARAVRGGGGESASGPLPRTSGLVSSHRQPEEGFQVPRASAQLGKPSGVSPSLEGGWAVKKAERVDRCSVGLASRWKETTAGPKGSAVSARLGNTRQSER